ncbi:MAG: hypothetical protein KAU62_07820 [Candidatus Heimdallarchaeota archaeon]|nr:hypothetical protein [Candidatus Heimdallarchaeota archaeon]MCK4611047.1 hypothetical protein [Candidatus Heimdallarchaeota archaeon]
MNNENQKTDYYKIIDDYLEKKFFKEEDRKISFLVGRFYNHMAYLENKVLKTNSLFTKLPSYTKRMDKEQILKVLEKSNYVAFRLISKEKSTASTGVKLRERINKILSEDNWTSSHNELSLAFMMGFSFYVPSDEKNKKSD